MYQRILVTLDGSKHSEAVLPEVTRLAAGSGAEVVLLSVAHEPRGVAEPPDPLMVTGPLVPGRLMAVILPQTHETRDQAIARVRTELEEHLQERARPLRSAGVDVRVQVGFGDPAEEIAARARSMDVGLIMMATHGRTGLAHVVFGSVAQRVVASGVRPVLLVRPPDLGQ